MGWEEHKPTLEKLTNAAEQSARTSVQLAEQLKSINDRVGRIEQDVYTLETDLKLADSIPHKKEICPYQEKMAERDRILFGEEGLIKSVKDIEKSINYYKGAIWILGAVTTVVISVLIVVLTKVL